MPIKQGKHIVSKKTLITTVLLLGIFMMTSPSALAKKRNSNEQSDNASESQSSDQLYGKPAGSSLDEPTVQPQAKGEAVAPANPNATSAGNAAPIVTLPSAMIDLSSANFGSLIIDLQSAQFSETAFEHAHLLVNGADFKSGQLKTLNVELEGGRFQQFVFDQLMINSEGDLEFDPLQLLNERILQFKSPARASVAAVVSQGSLNQFLGNKNTLDKLSVTVSKRLGALAQLIGASANTINLTLTDAQVILAKGNKVVILCKANLGMIGVDVPLTFEIDAVLGIKNGWVCITDAHLITNGQEISPQLSQMLLTKINSLATWGQNSDDIHFEFTDLKVVPGKQFSVEGTALIKRLRLTKQQQASTNHGYTDN